MGTYLNPGDGLFKIALNSQIFVDKSRLLEVTNRCVGTMQRFVCVSRREGLVSRWRRICWQRIISEGWIRIRCFGS